MTLDRSTLAGASIASGATGTFSFGAAERPTYTAKGEVAGVDVQQVGREFNIPALATDRFHSTVSGPFDVSGSGGGSYPLTLDVTGTLVDSQLFGASIPAHGRARPIWPTATCACTRTVRSLAWTRPFRR